MDLGVNWACETAEPFLRVLLDERHGNSMVLWHFSFRLLDFLSDLVGLPMVAMRLELFEKRRHG